MENKEIYELLETIIAAQYPNSKFINGNRIEYQEALQSVIDVRYPVFIYSSLPQMSAALKPNHNTIEETTFRLSVLSVQENDLPRADKDNIYEANKTKGQIIINALAQDQHIELDENDDINYNISQLEDQVPVLACGAGFEVLNLPLQKWIDYES